MAMDTSRYTNHVTSLSMTILTILAVRCSKPSWTLVSSKNFSMLWTWMCAPAAVWASGPWRHGWPWLTACAMLGWILNDCCLTSKLRPVHSWIIYYTFTGWWFGTFFYFPIYWVSNHPKWLSYFWEGFKPPTSLVVIIYNDIPLIVS